MPVAAIRPITPLSAAQTHQFLANSARALAHELDNERVQNSNIRNYINIGISHIAQLMNMSEAPWYGISWELTLEAAPHISGVQWCDLATPIVPAAVSAPAQAPALVPGLTTVVPANLLWKVKRITGAGDPEDPSIFAGNFTKLSIEEITTLATNSNNQYRHTIAWCHHGSEIYFHVGAEIGAGQYYSMPTKIVLWGHRKPLLDNLMPETQTGSSWTALIDLPDSDMRLLLLMVQKMIMEQVNKVPDQAHTAEIAQLTAQITGNLVQEVQYEASEREKRRYGNQGR